MCDAPEHCCISDALSQGSFASACGAERESKRQKICFGLLRRMCELPRYGRANKVQSDHEDERRLKVSGPTESQTQQTFKAYDNGGALPEIVIAKAKAILAAQSESILILAGKAGTGKTHLAIETMKHKRSALFRSVPELLDEIRERAKNHVLHLIT